MKLLKLALVIVISLGATSVYANEASGAKFYDPNTEAASKASPAESVPATQLASKDANPKIVKPARQDVAGFVIAARGSLTATDSSGETRTLSRRSKFYANEVLKTGEGSRAQLRFKDRALMTLRPKSELNIGEYHFGGAKDTNNRAFLNLVSGGFRTISGAIGKANKSAYRVTTPAASIGIRGTDYELVISLDGKVFAAVHGGGITLTNEIGDLDLGADSDYLFAEVGAGQSPLGLDQMPTVFQVKGGEKQELSQEQKEKLAKKLSEGKKKAEALLARLGDENTGEKGDRVRRIFEEALANNSAFDTRLPPEQLAALKASNTYYFAGGKETGGIREGRMIKDANGDPIVNEIKNNDIYKITGAEGLQDQASQAVSPSSTNVEWQQWNTGIDFGQNGSQTPFTTNDQFFASVQAMDVAKILMYQQLAMSVSLDLQSLTVFSKQPDFFTANTSSSTGITDLNFGSNQIAGDFTFVLEEVGGGGATIPLTVSFSGSMLNNNVINTEFAAVLTDGTHSSSSGTTVYGVVGDNSNASPGVHTFSGAFEADLPNEITGGIPVGVHGLHFFEGGGLVENKPMDLSSFL